MENKKITISFPEIEIMEERKNKKKYRTIKFSTFEDWETGKQW